ncbi:hypothetical protein PMAYCL1PPCAC_04562, partial [Pristionchus mayeri]
MPTPAAPCARPFATRGARRDVSSSAALAPAALMPVASAAPTLVAISDSGVSSCFLRISESSSSGISMASSAVSDSRRSWNSSSRCTRKTACSASSAFTSSSTSFARFLIMPTFTRHVVTLETAAIEPTTRPAMATGGARIRPPITVAPAPMPTVLPTTVETSQPRLSESSSAAMANTRLMSSSRFSAHTVWRSCARSHAGASGFTSPTSSSNTGRSFSRRTISDGREAIVS